MSAGRAQVRRLIGRPARIGRRWIERLAHENYYSAHAYYTFRLRFFNSLEREQVIVYQMGKVGSSTVLRSLKALKRDASFYHVHTLTAAGLAHVESVYKQNWALRSGTPKHLFYSKFLMERLAAGASAKRWKVVTLVRDPIARNVSAFFQLVDDELAFGLRRKLRSMRRDELIDVLLRLFVEEFDHDVPLRWFDREMRPVFGLDVFATGFPHWRGYETYRARNADVLLLRLEDLDRCAPEAFRRFMGLEGFRVLEANVSRAKYYSAVYSEFLERLRLPDRYIDRMYTSRYARHFYTAEEIDRFVSRWRTPGSASPLATAPSTTGDA